MRAWLVGLVARVPVKVHAKLLAAFLVIVVLLIVVGAVGLQTLNVANRRAEQLVQLQRKMAAYRQLQHDTVSQLYAVSSALLVPDERTLDTTLRQLNQFGYDLDRLQFVARDEVELLGRVRQDYEQFINVVTRVIELIRAGRVAQGREVQQAQATPLADDLERLTNELVNKAEADMVASIDETHDAYVRSRGVIAGFAVATIALALVLGYVISWSLIAPVQRMNARLERITAGDFAGQVDVPNRDELGALAANLNRMSAELGRLYEQIEAASRHKSEFLANMSHELRTPLNAIIGYSELLEEEALDLGGGKLVPDLQKISTAAKHQLSLINDILDLSKIEAGRMELEVGDVDLPTAIDDALALVRERAARRGIALGHSVEPDVGSVRADERKVKQVLLNLLSNALKFTPEGGRIDVSAVTNGDVAEISVADTGVGIDREDQEAVFEEFRQVGAAAKRVEGTGLGLALSRKFVELHGGRIWVKSRVGEGSTFTFTLPVRRGA